jgi:hypothetical protein
MMVVNMKVAKPKIRGNQLLSRKLLTLMFKLVRIRPMSRPGHMLRLPKHQLEDPKH